MNQSLTPAGIVQGSHLQHQSSIAGASYLMKSSSEYYSHQHPINNTHFTFPHFVSCIQQCLHLTNNLHWCQSSRLQLVITVKNFKCVWKFKKGSFFFQQRQSYICERLSKVSYQQIQKSKLFFGCKQKTGELWTNLFLSKDTNGQTRARQSSLSYNGKCSLSRPFQL